MTPPDSENLPTNTANRPSTAVVGTSWKTRLRNCVFGRKTRFHHRIEISLRDLSQLFNSMDPSPFHEKDLDRDAEEFIESWVSEYHRDEPVNLIIHLQQVPEDSNTQSVVETSIHNYFAYRAKLNQLEFKRLMKQGRLSLVIGLVFLGVCLAAGNFIGGLATGALNAFLREGLMIAGWVAMWRPMEIYLYQWWPLRRRGEILEKMSKMRVEVRQRK